MQTNRGNGRGKAFAVALAALALFAVGGAAQAGVSGASAADIPAIDNPANCGLVAPWTCQPYNVGDTIPASPTGTPPGPTLVFANFSTGSPYTTQLINVTNIRFTPSCAADTAGFCDPDPLIGADPGVFEVSNFVGRAGSACAGTTFTPSADPSPGGAETGRLVLTPSAPVVLGSRDLQNGPTSCTIDFDVKVVKRPNLDADPAHEPPNKKTYGIAMADFKNQLNPPEGPIDISGNTNILNIVGPSLAIDKTASPASINAGQDLVFKIKITNSGDGDATGIQLQDALPTGLTWTLTPQAGCSMLTATSLGCNALTVAAASSVTLTVTAPTSSTGCPAATITNNFAQISGFNSFELSQDAIIKSGPATITCSDVNATLQVTKTDGSTTYTPGAAITYTIVVTNDGPATATGATVSDVVPAAITGVTANCTATGTANCGTKNLVGNNLSYTGVSLAVGGVSNFLTITVSGTVNPAATGTLVNTVTATPVAGTPGSASDSDDPSPVSNLSVTKSDGKSTYVPGGTNTYTIVVSNAGPSNVIGATVADAIPPEVTSWSWACASQVSASGCTPAASNSSDFSDTVDIAAGGSITYTVVALTKASATTSLVNTVTVAVPVGWTDSNTANNVATDTDTAAPTSTMTASKTDGTAAYTPGQTLTYTIVVGNNGPSDAVNATVFDAKPVQIASWTWACQNIGAATGCDGAASNSANFSDTVTIPVGSSIVYTVTAIVSGGATDNLVNTVTITPTSGTPGTGTDVDTPPPPPITNIPTLGEYGLLVLMLLMAMAGGLAVRRSRS